MIVLGLTGSIAMGKSRAAAAFRQQGVPVFDADGTVHLLLAAGGQAVDAVEAAFPGTRTPTGAIDRKALGRRVFDDPAALRRLEAILHPAVRAAQGRFLRRAARAGVPLVVLDIPLLLETAGERRVDRVVVVSASRLLQRQRALTRPGMTQERLQGILRQQMPDAQKRRRADYVIPSGRDLGELGRRVALIVADARRLRPRAWPDGWLRRASGASA